MAELRIMSRQIRIKNREGKERSYAFSILNVILSAEASNVIQSSLNTGFSVEINAYSIEPYNVEVPATLYTDFILSVKEEESCISLFTA